MRGGAPLTSLLASMFGYFANSAATGELWTLLDYPRVTSLLATVQHKYLVH